MKLTKLFSEFSNSEKAGGVVLIVCTAISLLLANSSFGETYDHFWHIHISGNSLAHWINDGLMTIFFLLIGLELEREIYKGELSNIKDAMLPVAGALGGMLVPAAIYLFFNYGTPTQSGAGIPMATDIAFALGVLSLLGNKVPASLKIFLTALAVIDDLGAILIIAVFYSAGLSWVYLLAALGIWGLLFILNRMKVHSLIPYLIGGVVMWYCMLHSGVHATITGVLLAFVIPFGNGGEKTVSYKLQHFLHKPVAFIILPVFAMANTVIVISSDWQQIFNHHYSAGIAAGLVAGKPLGILLVSFIAVKTGLCKLPGDFSWKEIFGVGFLGGIGFTMSIFITLLAFDNADVINNAKLIILVSSLVAGIIGFVFLKMVLKKQQVQEIE
ncbi:MAG: Na+/H+ antiporter NhaA [Bacteroidota bacterium]